MTKKATTTKSKATGEKLSLVAKPTQAARIAESVEAVPEPEKRTHQSAAPVCPYCKGPDGKPNTVCKSLKSTFYHTRYKCPTNGCPYRIDLPRKNIAQRVQAVKEAEAPGVAARPRLGEVG